MSRIDTPSQSTAVDASPGPDMEPLEISGTVLRRRLPLFSVFILVAITALAMAAYTFSARKTNEAYAGPQLMFASETLKMLLYSLVEGDLALLVNLADSDTVKDYLRSPFDPELETKALTKFGGFERFLRKGAFFWSSAADRRLWSSKDPTRSIPKDAPGFEWYDLALNSGQPCVIDIEPNHFTGRQTVWLNVPVKEAGPLGAPLGLLGAGIELDLWLSEADTAIERLDPNLTWFLFDSEFHIITATDLSLTGRAASALDELSDISSEINDLVKGNRPPGAFQKGQNIYQTTYIPDFNWHLVVKYRLPDLIAIDLPFNIMFFSMFLIFFIIIFAFNVFIRRADRELAAGRQRLILANREAEKASKGKSDLLAIVSHELRTPLNAIIGVSRLILREDTSKTVREHAANVKQAGDSAMALITDLLDLSKIETGHFEIANKPYWLGSLVQDVINIIRLRISDTELSLVIKVDPALPARLSGDEIRLRRILLNLMGNAVKYTQEGHVSLSISRGDDQAELANSITPGLTPTSNEASNGNAETSQPGDSVTNQPGDAGAKPPIGSQTGPAFKEGQIIQLIIEVADSGIGIKQENLADLFKSFMRFDRELNQNVEGSGLGLSITKQLIESMGGKISVSSIYGVGSVFTAAIPQTVASPAPVGDGPIPSSAYDDGDLSVHFLAPEARILIVDDIRTNLKVGRGLLAAYEAKIDLCDNAREAVGLVEKGAYNLVFLDHMMPFMTGVEVAAKIRAMEGPASQTPLIALTGDAGIDMANMFLEKGFNDVLAKPVDLARLGEVMDRWIPMSLRQDPATKRGLGESGFAGPIPRGLNVAEGLSRSGGKTGYYLEVLSCFRNDALERLPAFQAPPDPSNLGILAGHLHGIKTAAGGIGANQLASQAGALEAIARRGDLDSAKKSLPGFLNDLSCFLSDLGGFIFESASKLADPGATLDPSALKRLITAFESEDIKKIDDLLESFPNIPSDTPAGALLSEINEAVLRLELTKAANLVKAHLADHCHDSEGLSEPPEGASLSL